MNLQFLLDTNVLSEPTRPIPNAIAKVNDLILVTNNVSDLADFLDLPIENWYV